MILFIINYYFYSFNEDEEEAFEEKSDAIFDMLVENGEMDRLIESAKDKSKNPLLDLKQGGAFTQYYIFNKLKKYHPRFYKLYKTTLKNQDKTSHLMRKVSRYAKNQSKSKVVDKQTVDIMTYVECHLAKYLENYP